MPYLISNLIEGQSRPTSVYLETPVEKALELMVENDFSQLPVIDNQERPLGLVTNDSILRALNNFGVKLEKLYAADALVKVDTFRPDDDLFDVLSRLKDNRAVLIVDGEGRLTGIATDFDAMAYFQRRAEDMMLIEDIELMVRNIVSFVFTDENGQLDEAGLEEAGKIAKTHWKTFDRFSMSDYVKVFLHENQWQIYGSKFSLEPEAIQRLLNSVRDTRNKLAHYRGETTRQERQRLRFCADWLARYHDQITVPNLEIVVNDEVSVEDEIAMLDVTMDEELAPSDSRYAPLAVWLQNQPSEKELVKPSFNKIEQIIGGELPASAYKHRSWWANDPINHPHSQQWLDVGWRLASVNMSSQVARFARIKERQKAYIDFFSALINELRLEPTFDKLQTLPDGTSWYSTKSILVFDRSLAFFNYSFGRGGIFRIELYVDSGDKAINKQIFDNLYESKEEIEQEIGQELSWQRLDSRRASRVALIFQGHITDSQEKLDTLRNKVVPAMVDFSRIMQPRVEAIGEKVLQTGIGELT